MTTNFVGPLLFDIPFQINVEMVREGKNVSQLLARIIQDGKNCVLTQFCFAKARQSKTGVTNNDQHNMAIPKKAQLFLKHPSFYATMSFQLMMATYPLLAKKKNNHYYGWIRLKLHRRQ